jgi:hypothetical protein
MRDDDKLWRFTVADGIGKPHFRTPWLTMLFLDR